MTKWAGISQRRASSACLGATLPASHCPPASCLLPAPKEESQLVYQRCPPQPAPAFGGVAERSRARSRFSFQFCLSKPAFFLARSKTVLSVCCLWKKMPTDMGWVRPQSLGIPWARREPVPSHLAPRCHFKGISQRPLPWGPSPRASVRLHLGGSGPGREKWNIFPNVFSFFFNKNIKGRRISGWRRKAAAKAIF